MEYSNLLQCIICMESDNKYFFSSCKTCKESNICVTCIQYYEDVTGIYNIKCPICKELFVNEILNNIIITPLVSNDINIINKNNLMKRLYNNYLDTDHFMFLEENKRFWSIITPFDI